MLKLDPAGNIAWQRAFGGSDNEAAHTIVQTSDGGFVIGGSSLSTISGNRTATNYGNFDYWIVKLDATGTQVWDRSFGGTILTT